MRCRVLLSFATVGILMLGHGLLALRGALAQEADATSILNARCSACHEPTADGGLERIKEIRKTPEGWDMTIVRMTQIHGLRIPAAERAALVKHLADTQGLAPSETEGYRYILERRPNVFDEAPDDELMVMCGRCHSFARVALQRRDTGEWLKHSHFHLGQYPTTEYQALGRDRNWWEIASTSVPEQLGKLYPFETPDWTAWKARAATEISGAWRVVGHTPGQGAYEGTTTVAKTGADRYRVEADLTYADGRKAAGKGSAILYTGYEVRGRLDMGDDVSLQVLMLSEDGTELTGRWFLEDNDAIGGEVLAVREDAGPRVLAVEPGYIKVGQTARIAVHGVGLGGTVSLGNGVRIDKTLSTAPGTIVVEATAAVDADPGAREVRVSETRANGLFTVYSQVDSVRVEPGEAIARVGGGGGPLPPVPAQFEAVAYINGPDGASGTDDDVRIGVMPAQWSVDNNNEVAADLRDKDFAGTISATGLFMPADAGPNPQRPFKTNNAGDLAIKAVVDDGGRRVEGTGHLIVTVQRWNDPPIR